MTNTAQIMSKSPTDDQLSTHTDTSITRKDNRLTSAEEKKNFVLKNHRNKIPPSKTQRKRRPRRKRKKERKRTEHETKQEKINATVPNSRPEIFNPTEFLMKFLLQNHEILISGGLRRILTSTVMDIKRPERER